MAANSFYVLFNQKNKLFVYCSIFLKSASISNFRNIRGPKFTQAIYCAFVSNSNNTVDRLGDWDQKCNDQRLNRKHVLHLEREKVMDILREYNVPSDTIEKYNEILNEPGCYWKLLLLQQITKNVVATLGLLALPRTILQLAAKQRLLDEKLTDFPCRISYLSHHLVLPVEELVKLLRKHTLFLTMSFLKLDARMQVLKKANIDPKLLVKDAWIFNYNEKLLLERVIIAEKNNIQLKPWLLRCSMNYFHKYIAKSTEVQKVLAGDDVLEFLSKRLQCSPAYVKLLMRRNRLLKTINVVKLEKILNGLIEMGYLIDEIRLYPRVFCFSIETLENRFAELYKIKNSPPTLAQLSAPKVPNVPQDTSSSREEAC